MKLIVLSFVLFVLFGPLLLGQPEGPGGPAPLGFTEFLLAAGAVYGARATLRRRIKSNRD